jgi:hypothetical protein
MNSKVFTTLWKNTGKEQLSLPVFPASLNGIKFTSRAGCRALLGVAVLSVNLLLLHTK